MVLLLPLTTLKGLLPILAIIAAVFVITTKNAIISVFNLIVLYILVAFYLIYIGITYLGISYIIIYIGAIAILFLFIIMMIDVEVVEKRNNNYLPLLFLLLSGFLLTLKNTLYNLGLMKMKNKNEETVLNYSYENLFNVNNINFISLKNENVIKHNNNNYELDQIKDNENDFKELLNEKEYGNIYNNKLNNSYDNILNYSPNINNLDIEIGVNYLLVASNWNTAVNRVTQITTIGDVLYTVYHSYIYILSVVFLLGMVGAILLTSDSYHEVKITRILKNKKNSISPFYIIKDLFNYRYTLNYLKKNNNFKNYFIIKDLIKLKEKLLYNNMYSYKITKKSTVIPSFFSFYNTDYLHTENILGNLLYFIIANFIIAILLLGINSYFSLSVKYLDKEGGFECGFTSFVQTRERFNVIFYRVSLLFLIFDLEIILVFPYTAIDIKNQNMNKNNVLAFLYILVIGFIYELKEGALNIVKKAHINEDKNNT